MCDEMLWNIIEMPIDKGETILWNLEPTFGQSLEPPKIPGLQAMIYPSVFNKQQL